jgi:regulatory protein YycI of two-component signal transduction system YycFG
MDWSRAKTILIWAFLFLDLFLGYQVYVSRTELWLNAEAVQGSKWDIELYLRQQQITLLAEVPQETPEMKYVNVENFGFDILALQETQGLKVTVENERSAISAQLMQPLPFDKQTDPDDLLRQMGQHLLYEDQYRADPYLSNKQKIKYWQLHGKYPIFNAPLDIHLENNLVTGYSQTYFHIRSQGSARQVISAYTALRSMVEKQIIAPGEKIESVMLGYFGYHYDADIQVLAPVWRVIHDGKTDYINGFTGAIERPLDTRNVSQP